MKFFINIIGVCSVLWYFLLFQDLLGFIHAMNDAVKGKALSAPCNIEPQVESILKVLTTLSTWVDEIPPTDQPQRYGNKAYRDFYNKLKEVIIFMFVLVNIFFCSVL